MPGLPGPAHKTRPRGPGLRCTALWEHWLTRINSSNLDQAFTIGLLIPLLSGVGRESAMPFKGLIPLSTILRSRSSNQAP